MLSNNDLENANPSGRLDVLVYRGVQKAIEHLEKTNGISGIWDAVKPHAHDAIKQHVSGLAIPTEAKVLIALLMMQPKKIEGE